MCRVEKLQNTNEVATILLWASIKLKNKRYIIKNNKCFHFLKSVFNFFLFILVALVWKNTIFLMLLKVSNAHQDGICLI